MRLNKLIDKLNNYLNLIKSQSDININYISGLLTEYDNNIKDLTPFIKFNTSKNYTRNLIYSDNKTYSLVLMCWNKNSFSPIHNHPILGCWAKPVFGLIQEKKYTYFNNELIKIEDGMTNNKVLFINNNIGLHKIGNPSKTREAISLHLYFPPLKKCNIYLNKNNKILIKYHTCNYYSVYDKEKIKELVR